MKKFFSAFSAAAMSATFAIASIAPANAAPVFVPNAQTAPSGDLVQVDYKKWPKNKYSGNNKYHGNNFRRNGNRAYYNGQRGYKYQRNGYRYYNGFWFPAGAFIAGAIIGGAINNGNNYSGGGSRHVQWCYDRYRSYRASDNSFQPYHGPRQQCYSPYS